MEPERTKDTLHQSRPIWAGNGFVDAFPDDCWQALPENLRALAALELQSGNTFEQILKNETRNIVLLSFDLPPKTPRPSESGIKVHDSFDYGNYCYDGTLCTYEDLESGCFLSFNNPDFEYE